MSIIETIRTALYGSPPSQAYQPSKEGVIDAFDQVVQSVTVLSGGVIGSTATIRATLTLLTAVSPADDTLGLVYDDPDPDLNGIYHRTAGAWVFTGLLGTGPEGPAPTSEAIDDATAAAEAAAAAAALSETAAELAADFALASGNYYATVAAGVAGTSVGDIFISDEGGWAWYRRIATGIFYEVMTNAFTGPIVVVAAVGSRAARHADYLMDGVADQVQINAAIAAVEALGGGEVFVAKAIVGTSLPIVVGTNVTLRSEIGGKVRPAVGWTSLADATGHISATGKTGFKVIGFDIDCVTNNIAGNGIECRPSTLATVAFNGTPCSNYTISNNTVRLKKGIHNYGIWSMRGRNVRILDNVVDGTYTNADTFTGALQQEGIEIYGGHDVLVQNNRVLGLGGAAYNLLGGTTDVGGTGLSDISMVDNYAEVCGRFIQCILTSHVTNGMGGMENTSVKNNRCRDAHIIGIDIQFVSNGSNGDPIIFQNNDVSDNIVEMAATGQIASSYGLHANNQRTDVTGINAFGNTFINNKLHNALNTDAGGRVYFAKMKNFKIEGNEVFTPVQASGSARGVFILLCADFDVINNTVDGARVNAIEMQGCVSGRVNGNTLLNWNQNAAGNSAIKCDSLGGTVAADMEIMGNRFKAATLTNIPTLIDIVAASLRCDHGRNTYIGTAYSGTITRYSGTSFPANVAATVLPSVDATVTPDFSKSPNFELAITGDRTLASPTNTRPDQSGFIRITQDATGSRVITYGNNWRFPAGAAVGGVLSTAANAIDVIDYRVGSDGKIYATLSKAFAV